MSSELPKYIGSWNDVVAWVNHLSGRIDKVMAAVPSKWQMQAITDDLDRLTFRWVEGDLAEVLLNNGDEEGPEHSMRWSEFRVHLVAIVRAYNLELFNPERLVRDLQFLPEHYRGAIYSERRGGGYRVLTDLQPVEKGASE